MPVMVVVGDPIDLPAFSGITPVAAVAILLGRLRQRFATAAGIQVNVSAQVPVATFVLNGKGLVPALEQVPRSTVPLGAPIGIAGEPTLHAATEVRLGGRDQCMNVVGHPAIGDDAPTASIDLIDKPLRESIIMSLVVKQFSPSVTSGNNVIDRILVPQAWKARHQETRRRGCG